MPTATGLRISSVDGTAFLDNCPSGITDAVGYQVKISDSSSRYLLGWIKEVGSSESLGSEIITGIIDNVTYPYDTLTINANNHDIDSAIGLTDKTYQCIAQPAAIALGKLIRIDMANYVLNSGQKPIIYIESYEVAINPTTYRTAKNSKFLAPTNNKATNYEIDFSLKQVTAPSSSGVTIVSTEGGTTYNWASKDSSFTYNAASYTYEIVTGHPTAKRFGGVPYCTQRKNIW